MVDNGISVPPTSRSSMPPLAPSQYTSWPRSCSARAVARAGNTWPPVPPAIIRKRRGSVIHSPSPYLVFLFLFGHTNPIQSFHFNPYQYPDRHAGDHQAGAAIAHQRQGQALGGQQAGGNGHVDASRSEERRVGKECRSRRSRGPQDQKELKRAAR